MELNRVLIVYKASLTWASADRTSKGKRSVTSISQHYLSLVESIKKSIEHHGIRTKVVDRRKLDMRHRADLIVSVGGDGTFLAVSHVAGKTPVVGVNFLPTRSVGFFCMAEPNTFSRIFKQILEGKRKPLELPLLRITIDGKPLKVMALNEALFSSPSPAEMSRYKLKIGRIIEYQRSSGVWISAGPGSSAALLSAGGRRQSITSTKLQYLVREPCPIPAKRYRLTKGLLASGTGVSVISQMPDSFVYLDGPDTTHPVPYNATMTVKAVPRALKVFI